MTHRREDRPDADLAPRVAGLGDAIGKSGPDGIDDLLQREPFGDVQLRREPEFGVNDAIVGEVEHRLSRHALKIRARLHDGDGVFKRLEDSWERARRGGLNEPCAERTRVRLGHAPPVRVRKFENRRGAKPAVQVIVKHDLRKRGQLGVGGGHGRVRARGRIIHET